MGPSELEINLDERLAACWIGPVEVLSREGQEVEILVRRSTCSEMEPGSVSAILQPISSSIAFKMWNYLLIYAKFILLNRKN